MALADVLADGPVAVYELADPEGSAVAFDSSGNGRHGVHVNDPVRLGCGMGYDGAADDTTLGNATLSLPLSGGSFEGWIYMDPDPSLLLFIGRDDSGLAGPNPTGNGWMLFTTKSGVTILNELAYRVAGREYLTGLDIDLIRAQRWVHAAITYDLTETRLYLDGILVHVGGAHEGINVQLPWHVSKNGEFDSWTKMRAANLAFFNYKLSAARVAAHASGGSPCPVGGIFIGSVVMA